MLDPWGLSVRSVDEWEIRKFPKNNRNKQSSFFSFIAQLTFIWSGSLYGASGANTRSMSAMQQATSSWTSFESWFRKKSLTRCTARGEYRVKFSSSWPIACSVSDKAYMGNENEANFSFLEKQQQNFHKPWAFWSAHRRADPPCKVLIDWDKPLYRLLTFSISFCYENDWKSMLWENDKQ